MPEKVVIGSGELWHGDCRDVLPLLPRFDLVLTDPPYGIGFAAQPTDYQRKNGMKPAAWDNAPAPDWLMGLMREKADRLIGWGGNYYSLPPTRGWLAWRKPDAPPSMADLELAWTSMDMNAKVFEKSVKSSSLERYGNDSHPTAKPAALVHWCLSFAPGAATVCDPFMGSGTTGVACAEQSKAFTGIERERKYFDIACERIARAQAQGTLLPPDNVGTPQQVGLELEP